MAARMKPLRDEHRELRPHIDAIRDAADHVGDLPLEALREEIEAVYRFLVHHLIPHATAEEEILYPMVSRAMGAPLATATMSRDHTEIGRLVEELQFLRAHLASATPGHLQEKALRRILYGLHALVSAHFAKEEEIYVPLLEQRLTDEAAREMFRAMDEAAGRAAAASALAV